MSYYSNPNRHVYTPSSHTRVSMRPNLSWSTIREETSTDLLSTEQDEKTERMSRLKKLERLKERRYMDYQSLKRRGNSQEYSDRFQRDCEEFNKLKYRQVHHTPSTSSFVTNKHRSISVSDLTSRRHMYSSRYGHTYLRGNQDDGQTLSPTGSVSSIVTLDDDYMYGSRYRTSSFSSSMARDRLGHYGLSSHEMLDDNLFDDTSSEYSFSGYVPQRRAFSSCVTPRKYSGLMTPTANNVDAAATVERMGQLQERLKLLQTERSTLERRRSVDLSSSVQMRSRLSSFDTETTSASTHGRYSQESHTILPQSPTDPNVPAWTQRVNLLLSSQHQDAADYSPDMDYSLESRESLSSYSSPHNLKNDSLSRSLEYQRQTTLPYGASPLNISHHYQDGQQTQTSYTNSQQIINVTNTDQNVQRPGSLFPKTENSNHLLKDGQNGADQNSDYQRTTEESSYSGDMSPSPISPGSYSKNYATIHSKTLIVRGQQSSQQDDISDSGVESSSDVGRVSGSVSNDSISKFVVSASKPSESRGRSKFEIALGSPGQRAGSHELSPEDAAYHSVQESPQEGTNTRDVQDSSSYQYTTRRTLRKYDNTPQSVEYDYPHDSKAQTETIATEKYTKNGRHDSVQADKTISDVTTVINRKDKIVGDFASNNLATMNVEMGGSPLKKDVSPVIMQYAERKSNSTVTEDMVAKRSKELAEQYLHLKKQQQQKQSVNIQSGEKQPEDEVHNSTETVTFNINRTSDVDSRDSMSHASKSAKGMENNTSTTTTIVKTADNYSTETKEQDFGTNVHYNQFNMEVSQSTDPMKVTESEAVITTDKVSETMPSVGKSERPADKNTKNVSKTLNQTETSQIAFKTVSEELESADIRAQKSVEKPRLNVTEQKNGSSSVKETTVSEEQVGSDLNVITPKRKRSKKKKSAKGGENNGLDSKPKTEEEIISTSETSVDLEFVSSSVDDGNLNQAGNKQPINGSQNGSHVGNVQLGSSRLVQSPAQTKTFKSSSDIIISKDVTTNVTIVESKQMMDATRETLNKLQSGEQSPLTDENKEIAPSVSSSKLATIGYQMTTAVDNINIQDPGRKSKEKLPDVILGVPGKMVEQNLKQETAEGSFQEKEGTTVISKGKSKKKKKNSFKKSKNDEQSEGPLGKTDDPTLDGSQEQGDMFAKVTSTTRTVSFKTSESPEEYSRQNISAEFPGQVKVPQQTEYTQGNLTDKVATTINTMGYKTSEKPEDYNTQSMSVRFPGQQIEVGKDGEMFSKVTTTTKTTSYEVDTEMPSGPEVYNVQSVKGKFHDPKLDGSQGDMFGKVTTTTKTVGFKTSERPEDYNVQSISAEFPGQVKSSQQMEFTQGNLTDKVATTTRTVSFKTSESPEEYSRQNISAEFPGQVKAPQQTEYTQGNMTDKVATTINIMGYKTSEKPEDYNTQSMSVRFPGQQVEQGKDGEMFTKVTTTTKTTSYEVDTEMPSGPEVYNVQSVKGKFPGKAEDPKLVGSVEQGDMFAKVATTTKTFAYKTSERPEEYNTQNISAEFPGQVKVPQQMEFTQGNMVDKVKTISNSAAYKKAPNMSERPEEYHVQSMSAEFPVQAEFPEQQPEVGKDGEILKTVTTTTKTTLYEVDSGLGSNRELTPKNVQENNSAKVAFETKPMELSLNSEDPKETEAANTSFFGRVASTLKSTFSLSPGSPNKSPSSSNMSEFIIPPMSEDSSSVDPIFSTSTTTIESTTSKTPEGQKDYSAQSISAEFPGQVKSPQQMEFTQGNLTDKVATTINTMAYKTSEKPEDYNTASMSVKFPGQQIEQGKDREMFTKVTTTTKTTSYEVDTEMPSGPEVYNVQSVNGKIQDPKLDGSQGDMFGKVTTTTKTVGFKTSERPEDYNVQSISAEFPGQVKSPQQMEFTQGNLTDKVATTINTMGYKTSEKPEDYNTQSMSVRFPGQQVEQGKDGEMFTKVTTTTKTTSYEVDTEMPSGPEVYNVQSVNGKFPGKADDPKLVGSVEQGDMFAKVATTTKTFAYKTSERPEEYNTQNISAEFPGQVKVPQQMEFTQGNMVDKVKTISNSAAYKKAPGISERPEEYHVQSVSAEFPGQITSPMQADFTQGNMVDKVVTATVSTDQMIPKMSDMPGELKVQSKSVEFPKQVTTSQEPLIEDQAISSKVVTITETISEKIAPEMSVLSKSELPQETESIEQGDASRKVVTTSKDVAYKPENSISQRIEALKAQTMSELEKPGTVTGVSRTTAEDVPAESPKEKSKPLSRSSSKRKKGSKKTPEESEETNVESAPAETASPPKDKQKKEKSGFLGKVATSLKSSFSKKSRGGSIKSEDFPELVKDSSNVQLNAAANAPNDSSKVSYKSVVDGDTVSSIVKSTPGDLDGKVTVSTKTTDLTKPGEQANLAEKVITISTTETSVSKVSETPEQYNMGSVSAEFPGQGPQQTGFTQDNLAEKSVTEIKMAANKMFPEMADQSEEYRIKSLSADFPGQQIEGGKMEYTQGNMTDKVGTIINSVAYKTSEEPENYNTASMSVKFPGQQIELGKDREMFSKVTTTTKTTSDEVDTGMPSRPEISIVQPVKADSPKMEFRQDNLDDKVMTISKTAGYVKATEIHERPEEYHVQSISADFPGQITSPMQTDFTQGNMVGKVVTTTVPTHYKTVPGMSDMTGELKVQSMSAEFPGLVEGPKNDQSSNQIGTPDMQTHTSYKTIAERGIKPQEQILSPTIQRSDFLINIKNSDPNASYTLSGDQPDLNTMSLESSHFTLEKPITSVKTVTTDQPELNTASLETAHFILKKPVTSVKTMTTDLNNSPVDSPTVRNGTMQKQEPANTLSQYDPRYAVDSISTELSGNFQSSETDVSYSPDFSTLSEPKPLTRQKSWSDVVKNRESADISDERNQPNISSSISIDKVTISGDRSPYPQQTENEGRFIGGESQAFVMGAPKDTYTPEYANIQSEDVVAPLKAKPMPPNKPLLRKLSGQDFSVADMQKTSKPVLKLVAPDITLLQTKFETDGWKPKVKSPTATMTSTTTIVQSELIRQSPSYDAKTQFAELEHPPNSAPVAPKRRSREFRSVSEDSTDGETASPNTTLHFKTQVDIPPNPQSAQPAVPKRKNKKNRKSDRTSSGSISSDTSESKNFNVSLDMNGSQPVMHPEFRMSDQDVFRDTRQAPRSPLESETRESFITENIISLNKSPHTSITSDTVDVGNLQEIIVRSPKVPSQPEKEHFDFALDNSPVVEKNPPFERSYSAGKSLTMPGQKKLPSSNNEEKQEQLSSTMSPDSKTRRWKSTEVLKGRVKPDVPPKNTGLNRVKSTSVKLLSKLQPKSKKSKSPRHSKDEDGFDPEPYDKGNGATREYPTLEKYPVRRKSRRRGSRNSELSSPKTPDSEKSQIAAVAPVAPLTFPLPSEENDEPVKERVYLSSWDPTPLLKDLYEIRLMDDDTEDLSHGFIEMEGLMEKLPMNKKKATLLKTWKRRYFRARNGWLLYYDNRNDEKPSDEVLLMGGQVHAVGNQVIGIDDGRGRYLMVRCPSPKEYEQWLTALHSQTTDNTRATYVRPSINAPNHSSKKVVMIEFGSMSIRAGILKEQATLPQLFFPNVVAISNENGMKKHVIGFDAYKPDVRHSSKLVQPLGSTDKVDKFKVDFETVPSLFTAIFKDLKIASKDYYVMLILPVNIIDEEKSLLMNILIDQFKVCGVCMAPQALLALYSYNSQSGIIVDIGERLEVLPIFEGFVIDAGHTLQTFGAAKIRQSLRSGLSSENYPLYSPLEQLLVRLVMEQTCFVSKNFKQDCQQYQENPGKYKETVYLKKFNLPDETYDAISHSLSRFVSPEGLFCKDLWGMDYPTIQSLVKDAIEACPMDNRRHLCRSIYLSGGVTLIPGFVKRLEEELSKQLNDTLVIQVHSSPQRYHAAYIGACALCSMPQFEQSCITSEEWKQNGSKAFQKWKMSS